MAANGKKAMTAPPATGPAAAKRARCGPIGWAAGLDIFRLARRMGISVAMIDRTYGHLAAGADEYERELLDAYDNGRFGRDGRSVGAGFSEAEVKSG
jgi:hypothetical protein